MTNKDSGQTNVNPPVSLETINPGIIKSEYAVRGKLAELATKVRKELESGSHSYPFEKTIQANLGNPQGCGQKPITFFRQVLCLMEYPDLLYAPDQSLGEYFPPDAIEKAEWLLRHVGSMGAYSSNSGVEQIRESVAKFISQRDGYPSSADDIYLTCGAFEGMLIALTLISGGYTRGEKIGVLVPVPHYPVYLTLLETFDLEPIPYPLMEQESWRLPSCEKIKEILLRCKVRGVVPRCFILINPSNPTGAAHGSSQIEAVVDLAVEERLLLLADEVYQTNIFPPSTFVSCKSVLRSLQAEHPNDLRYSSLQLISLHSASKGMIGEGGQRGGYFEAIGFPLDIKYQLQKLVTYTLQPATAGQILVECMVNPPRPGDASYERYKQEYDAVFLRLKTKANALFHAFQRMPGIECQPPQGAIYHFPRVNLPSAALRVAAASGEVPDVWYCTQVLKATGVCIVPGSGFGMSNGVSDGRIWFRVTFLGEGEDWITRLETFLCDFMKHYGQA